MGNLQIAVTYLAPGRRAHQVPCWRSGAYAFLRSAATSGMFGLLKPRGRTAGCTGVPRISDADHRRRHARASRGSGLPSSGRQLAHHTNDARVARPSLHGPALCCRSSHFTMMSAHMGVSGRVTAVQPGRRPNSVASELHRGVHTRRSTCVSLFKCRGSVCHRGMRDAAIHGQRFDAAGRVATPARASLAQLS